jgi:hypothetical protein
MRVAEKLDWKGLTDSHSVTNSPGTSQQQQILVNFSPKHFQHIITTCALQINPYTHHI